MRLKTILSVKSRRTGLETRQSQRLFPFFTALAGLALAELILRPVRAFAVRTALVSQGEVSSKAPLPRTYRELSKANKTLINEIAQRRESEAKVQELSRDLAHFSR